LASEAFPEDKSDPPKPDEWKSAKLVRPTRSTRLVRNCRTWLGREGIKVHCDWTVAGIRLLAGSSTGVRMWVPQGEPKFDAPTPLPSGGEVIFPARRGDRRVFEFFELVPGDYEGMFPSAAMTVEEIWLEGAKAPEVALVPR